MNISTTFTIADILDSAGTVKDHSHATQCLAIHNAQGSFFRSINIACSSHCLSSHFSQHGYSIDSTCSRPVTTMIRVGHFTKMHHKLSRQQGENKGENLIWSSFSPAGYANTFTDCNQAGCRAY